MHNYGCAPALQAIYNATPCRFPLKNKELLQKWVDATRRANFTPTSNSCLCSAHFTKNDYQIRPGAYIPYLRTTAVPSVFCFANRGNVSRQLCILPFFTNGNFFNEIEIYLFAVFSLYFRKFLLY